MVPASRTAAQRRRSIGGSPYPRQVSSPCRFCGATDRQITKEHIWPDWLRDYLPPGSELGDIERYSPAPSASACPNPSDNDGEGLL
jgi:hypothetical protein